jgi:hypothetical protein
MRPSYRYRSLGDMFFYPGGIGFRLPVLSEVCSSFGPTCVCLQVQVASDITLPVIPWAYFQSVGY